MAASAGLTCSSQSSEKALMVTEALPPRPEEPASGEVDLGYWATMPGWRVREQAALLLNLDPLEKANLSHNREFMNLYRRLNRARVMNKIESPMT